MQPAQRPRLSSEALAAQQLRCLFAASHPERTRALVLYAPVVRTLEARPAPLGAGPWSAGASPTNDSSPEREPARTSTERRPASPTTIGSSSGRLGSNGRSLPHSK